MKQSKKTAVFRLNECKTIAAAEVTNNRRLIYAKIGSEVIFMQTVQEIYQASIRPLGESEKLQIATLILEEITQIRQQRQMDVAGKIRYSLFSETEQRSEFVLDFRLLRCRQIA